jgi:organic radical activating enzyme
MQDNKTICILPFIHLYSEPKGEMKPCCIADGFDTPLNLKTMSIEEAFNSEQMKELRKDMLSGKRNKVCDVCYKKEDLGGDSPRENFNSNTLWKMPEVNADYSVESQFQHIDIRFSNLCNFKCRMCNHDFSSNWFEDTNKLYADGTGDRPKIMKVSDTIVSDLKPHLSILKSIYFAGGEPLIMPEHYEVLKFLYNTLPLQEHNGKRKLSIHYNTNLSVIKYDEQSLVDLWQGFQRVFLSISCDGIGKVGEYQRTGFNHERFIDNLNIIKKYFTPADAHSVGEGMMFNFQYTTTIWNAYHIFDFTNFMLDNGYITSSDQIDFYYAWVPNHTSINNLTKSEKRRLVEFLEVGMDTNNVTEKTILEIENIINYIRTPNTTNIESLLVYTKELDELNNTNVMDLKGVNFNNMLQETYK